MAPQLEEGPGIGLKEEAPVAGWAGEGLPEGSAGRSCSSYASGAPHAPPRIGERERTLLSESERFWRLGVVWSGM